MHAHAAPIGREQLHEPSAIAALLAEMQEGSVVVSIHAADGSAIRATLWAHDASRGMLSFSADADDPKLHALVECDAATLAAELDDGVVRFDLHSLVLVRRGRDCALSCAYPEQVDRFHRRASVRVRPIARTTAIVRLHHPQHLAMRLVLRILDVSTTGCALFLPEAVPSIEPGSLLKPVLLELDAQTRLRTALQVQHVVALHPRSRGVRLGCQMVGEPLPGDHRLEAYVEQAQRRLPFFTLS